MLPAAIPCRGPPPACVPSRRAPRRITQCSAEFVPYTPVAKRDSYDLRLIEPHPVARTTYERRDAGFLRLGEYLSGGNAAGARFLETQPVVMTYPPGAPKSMQVYLVPRDAAAAACAPPPQPLDSGVALDAGGGEVVAVARFEGSATQAACEGARQQLLDALERDGLQLGEAEAAGSFRLAQYGPIFSLATRVNELWMAVKL